MHTIINKMSIKLIKYDRTRKVHKIILRLFYPSANQIFYAQSIMQCAMFCVRNKNGYEGALGEDSKALSEMAPSYADTSDPLYLGIQRMHGFGGEP